MGFPGGSDGKESACNAGDVGLISGSRRSLGKENGNPLQYSYLENLVGYSPWSLEELDRTEWLTQQKKTHVTEFIVLTILKSIVQWC